MQKVTLLKKEDAAKNRKWLLIDADGVVLGDLAVKVANILRGKDKPNYTPGVDGGDYVIVKNAAKVKLTGKKLEQKRYYRSSGWIGHLKSKTAGELLVSNPKQIIEDAVSGMLPKNKLSDKLMRKLFVYPDDQIRQQAQNPVEIKV